MDSIKYLTNTIQTLLSKLTSMGRQGAARKDVLCCMGLDSRGLSFVCLRKVGNEMQLDFAETVPCDPNKPEVTLTALVQQHELTNAPCIWILNSGQYHLLQQEALPVKDAEFQSAIRWQIRKLLPFAIDDALIDQFPIPPAHISNPKKMIMVVVAQQSYVQPIALQIRAAGLNLQTIDIQELGMRNLTTVFENDDASTALIHLSGKATELIITREKAFYFSRHLEWSLEHFEKLSPNTEETHGYLDKLSLEVQRSFDYFQSQWRIPAPSRVLVVSPNPETQDLAAYLSQRIRVQADNINFSQIMPSRQALTTLQGSQYLPLLGAALRSEIDYATAN
jgi:MSHA biogenesis protein MshI